MSVSSTDTFSGPLYGNGSTTAFPFTFKALTTAEVAVEFDVSGVRTVVDPLHYAVTLAENGGTVTFGTAPAEGTSLYIISDPLFTQNIQFANQERFGAEAVNEANDRSAVRDLILRGKIDRSIKYKVGTVVEDITPTPGAYLSFDADGQPVMASGTGSDAALRPDIATTTGSSLLGWIQSGLSAVARSVLSRLRDTVHVTDFGATGDDATDDAPAIRACIAAHPGKRIYFPKPAVAYLLGSSLGDIPAGTHLVGPGRYIPCLKRGWNGGYMANLLNGTQVSDMTWDCNGATYTGGGFDIPLSAGNQSAQNFRILDANGAPCIHFNCTTAQASGSQSRWKSCYLYRIDATAGSGKYAVEHDDMAEPYDPLLLPVSHPIEFHDVQTGGSMSFSFGACNNFTVSDPIMFEFKTSDYSRAVRIIGARISSPSDTITLKGSGIIEATFVSPKLVIAGAPSPVPAWVVSGIFNMGTEDLSSPTQSLIHDQIRYTFVPECAAGGVPITIGDGSIEGRFWRSGITTYYQIRLIVGATTVIPAGAITFSIPRAAGSDLIPQTKVSGNIAVGSAIYALGGHIATGASVVRVHASSGNFTNAAPVAFGGGVGAVIELSGEVVG